MPMTITASEGNDTEGLEIDNALMNALYPQNPQPRFARDHVKWLMTILYQLKTGVPFQNAENFVNQHTTIQT